MKYRLSQLDFVFIQNIFNVGRAGRFLFHFLTSNEIIFMCFFSPFNRRSMKKHEKKIFSQTMKPKKSQFNSGKLKNNKFKEISSLLFKRHCDHNPLFKLKGTAKKTFFKEKI